MRKRFVFMLLSLAMILAVVSPVAMAADNQLVISMDEAFLWESSSDRKTLYGVNPEWYKKNVTDAGPVLESRDSEPNASRFAWVEALFVEERRMLSSAHH